MDFQMADTSERRVFRNTILLKYHVKKILKVCFGGLLSPLFFQNGRKMKEADALVGLRGLACLHVMLHHLSSGRYQKYIFLNDFNTYTVFNSMDT